jgi:hypothetical protein
VTHQLVRHALLMSVPQIAFVGLTGAMLPVTGRGEVADQLAMRSIGYTAA